MSRDYSAQADTGAVAAHASTQASLPDNQTHHHHHHHHVYIDRAEHFGSIDAALAETGPQPPSYGALAVQRKAPGVPYQQTKGRRSPGEAYLIATFGTIVVGVCFIFVFLLLHDERW